MEKTKIMAISSDLAELILEACEKSRTGEISAKTLTKIINDYLTKIL